jgi:hypothetical protein
MNEFQPQGKTESIVINDKLCDIDVDIVGIVKALNAAGLRTIASCSGHGVRPSSIALYDGREVLILPDHATARKVDRMFPPLNPSGLFYVQDKRQYLGNAILWWREGGGYTANLQQAEVFDEERAKSVCKSRSTDLAWPKDYIDVIQHQEIVDMQIANQEQIAHF